MEKWIIDTNIAVHWLIANRVLELLIKCFHLSPEFATVYENRYKGSCDFIDRILEVPRKDNDFLMVELSINELFSGLRDEIRAVILFTKGVPISRWASRRETEGVQLDEELSRNTHELVLKGFDTLFGGQKIRIVETTTPSDAPDYLDVYSSLIFLHPMLRTQDAMLITTAIFERATRFVTTDKDLIRVGRALKERYEIEVLLPTTALPKVR